MTELSSRALLVSLNISQWTARKLDRKETNAVAVKHGTAGEVARVNKALLPAALSLHVIHKLTDLIRREYYAHTLPWGPGQQIIRADAYVDFCQRMAPEKSKWEAAVAQFVQEYPQLREDAKVSLNTLYSDDDYPDPAAIRHKFALDIGFYPVPDAKDWRIDISDEAAAQLKADLERQVAETQGLAMREAWRRVYEVASKAYERLSQTDAVFRNSLIENAVELCHILPALNLTGDTELEQMRVRLERSLCSYAPDTLRQLPDVRSDVADEMKSIMAKMEAMYGFAA